MLYLTRGVMSKILDSLKFTIKYLIYVSWIGILFMIMSYTMLILYPFKFINFIDNIANNILLYLSIEIDTTINKISE